MSKYKVPIFGISLLTLIASIVSWIIYPEWGSEPAGVIILATIAIVSILVAVRNGTGIARDWMELTNREKIWEESPLEKTSPEIIRADMGKGGQVSFINRGATDENLLWHHSKIIITGLMKVGKTREAARREFFSCH